MDSTLNPSMALHKEEDLSGGKIGDFIRYIFATLMVDFSDSRYFCLFLLCIFFKDLLYDVRSRSENVSTFCKSSGFLFCKKA